MGLLSLLDMVVYVCWLWLIVFCLCLCWVACLFDDCWLLLGFGAVLVYLVVGGGCFTCLLVDCCGLLGWVVWFLMVVSTDLFVSI